jgi:hypothetical protein
MPVVRRRRADRSIRMDHVVDIDADDDADRLDTPARADLRSGP